MPLLEVNNIAEFDKQLTEIKNKAANQAQAQAYEEIRDLIRRRLEYDGKGPRQAGQELYYEGFDTALVKVGTILDELETKTLTEILLDEKS